MKDYSNYVCCFGEILWDMLPSGKMPGGAPMNVAIHLRNLGMDVACITKVGNDPLGDELKVFLKGKGCDDTWVQKDDEHPTGTVKVNISDRTNVQYEIVQPVAWDYISPTAEALGVTKNAYALVFGTLACREKQSRETLLKLLDNSKAIKIFDVNLRAPHYTKELIDALMRKSEIVKMNEDELVIVHKWLEASNGSLEQMMKNVKTKFGLKKVIVTRGGDGAMLLDDHGLHSSMVYKVEVKDTIGSGDSFLAGMIKNFYLKNSPEQSLNYSCALGAMVAQHHGANPQIKESEILEMMESVRSSEL
jgi:fructokinase